MAGDSSCGLLLWLHPAPFGVTVIYLQRFFTLKRFIAEMMFGNNECAEI